MNRKRFVLGIALCFLVIFSSSMTAAAKNVTGEPNATRLVTGLQGASGSTIGPGGALYVTEGAAGKVTRVDPKTGAKSTFATGLPLMNPAIGLGGAMDVVFIDKTAYVLVTLVGSDVGGSSIVGIYRVDGPNSFTVIADIGEFSIQNPPSSEFFVPSGLQYALETYRGGFLVTDGHHNRVLRVTLDGTITELIAFDNIVPTGLDVFDNKVYMAEAGPVPHLPQDGKIVSFKPKSPAATEVASGASLLVDVEFGRDDCLYALSQGDWASVDPGSPALPNTGKLVKVNRNGSFSVIKSGLDRPTSLEFIGKNAFIVTLAGEIWKIDGVSR